MTEGEAYLWKENFIDEAETGFGFYVFGTYENFRRKLKVSFEPFDTQGDALEELKNLKMKMNLIDEHIRKWKLLFAKTKLGDN